MIITQYLLKNIAAATVSVSLALTSVIWLNLLLGRLPLFVNSGASFKMLLQLVLLSTPQFLEVMLPLALVIAILFIYSKMAADKEITAMQSSGISHYALAKPALTVAAVMTALLLYFTTYLTPSCFFQMHALRQAIAKDYSIFLLREGVFNSFGTNMTIYVRSRKDNGEFEGLMIYDARDTKLGTVTVMAKRGQVKVNGEIPYITLYDGVREQQDSRTGAISKLHFEQYTLEISMPEERAPKGVRTADERTLRELIDYSNEALPRTRNYHDVFFAEANNRIVAPFNAIGFAIVAASLVLLRQPGRLGHQRSIIAAALIIGMLESIDIFLVNAAKTNLRLLPLLYIFTFLPIAVGAFFLHARGEHFLAVFRSWLKGQMSHEHVAAPS